MAPGCKTGARWCQRGVSHPLENAAPRSKPCALESWLSQEAIPTFSLDFSHPARRGTRWQWLPAVRMQLAGYLQSPAGSSCAFVDDEVNQGLVRRRDAAGRSTGPSARGGLHVAGPGPLRWAARASRCSDSSTSTLVAALWPDHGAHRDASVPESLVEPAPPLWGALSMLFVNAGEDYVLGGNRGSGGGGGKHVASHVLRRSAALLMGLMAVFFAWDGARFLGSMGPGWEGRWRALLDRGRPDPGSAAGASSGQPNVLLDMHGRLVAAFSQQSVPLNRVSWAMQSAVLASEDRRFFQHAGVDPRGMARAVLSLGRLGGGSTITQQVVKNALLSPSRTLSRKAAELYLSLVLEQHMAKHDILEHYLNAVYWGHGIYGVAGAAAAYFGKSPADLDLNEAATLAGMLPGPEHRTPFHSPAAGNRGRLQVLDCMAQMRVISRNEAKRIAALGLPHSLLYKSADAPPTRSPYPRKGVPPQRMPRRGSPHRAPFFVKEALFELRTLLGEERLARASGLRVRTTVHLDLQEAVEALVKEDVGPHAPWRRQPPCQAAAVVVSPGGGEVRAVVGSRDFAASSFNRATDARRAPGSAFKPAVYLAAFDRGLLRADSVLVDEDVLFRKETSGAWRVMPRGELDAELAQRDDALRRRYLTGVEPAGTLEEGDSGAGEVGWAVPRGSVQRLLSARRGAGNAGVSWQRVRAGGGDDGDEGPGLLEGDYTPANYSRGFRGRVTARQALAESLNIPTVKVGTAVGVDAVAGLARRLGVRSPLRATLSLCLGASEMAPVELAAVFNAVGARGFASPLHCVVCVEDASGEVMARAAHARERVVSAHACRELHACLVEAAGRSLGRDLLRGWGAGQVAGKTGTSDAYRDAWFAGYTSKATCVVWCGHDDGAPLPGTGAMIAGPLWVGIMRAAASML